MGERSNVETLGSIFTPEFLKCGTIQLARGLYHASRSIERDKESHCVIRELLSMPDYTKVRPDSEELRAINSRQPLSQKGGSLDQGRPGFSTNSDPGSGKLAGGPPTFSSVVTRGGSERYSHLRRRLDKDHISYAAMVFFVSGHSVQRTRGYRASGR